MSEQTAANAQSMDQIQANLRQLAASLRGVDHLEPETQNSLASLLDELSTELHSTGLVSVEKARLAEAVSEVARSLQQQHAEGALDTAQERLKHAAVQAEVEAPVATGVVYRIIDVLGSIGI